MLLKFNNYTSKLFEVADELDLKPVSSSQKTMLEALILYAIREYFDLLDIEYTVSYPKGSIVVPMGSDLATAIKRYSPHQWREYGRGIIKDWMFDIQESIGFSLNRHTYTSVHIAVHPNLGMTIKWQRP